MMNDLAAFATWYGLSLIIGLAGWLIAFRMLSGIPDRGLGLSRIVGLLASGTLVWWGGTLGLLPNSQAGNTSALLLIIALGFWLNREDLKGLWSWLKQHWSQFLLMELLFLFAFGLWTFVRANSPEIVGTEKPMELAFLNSISASDAFPPPDPWLAGYAISYYYFGFVLAGIMTQISGVIPSVAFNLTSAFWFALTILGAYSLAYNLISAKAERPVLTWPLLGPLFVAISGNIEGFLEVLHSRQLFWRQTADGTLTSAFWRWLDIKTLVNPPLADPTWIPERHWWWWRASRVVRDLNLAGVDHEVIDEFPFFSFLLADIHPHVLALPFALLAIAFVFHLLRSNLEKVSKPLIYLNPARWRMLQIGLNALLGSFVVAATMASGLNAGMAAPLSWQSIVRGLLTVVLALAALNFMIYLLRGDLPRRLRWVDLLAAGWIFGAMAFLNTWDLPIYLSLLFFTLLFVNSDFEWRPQLRAALTSSAAVLLVGLAMYLPWYPTFASQAGGVLPNLGFPTKFQQFFVMFAPIYVPLIAWVLWKASQNRTISLREVLVLGLGLPLLLWLLAWLLAALLSLTAGPSAIGAALDLLGVDSTQQGVRAALSRQLLRPWTALLMGLTVALIWSLLGPGRHSETDRLGPGLQKGSPDRYTALLIATGALLVLGPEFLYLKDLFGTRMNTIFKFYFATWILWGVAAAYVSYEFRPRSLGDWARSLIWLPLLLGLFYPVMGLITRTQGFNPSVGRTLDGAAYLAASQPEDAAAIGWLNANVENGVIAEAVGGSYSQYARIATHTPLRTVLGWEFHEIQWRGNAEAQGNRKAEIEQLYRTSDWREAQEIIQRYEVDYVYIGPLERSTYGVIRQQKFEAFMDLIYQQGDVSIYAMSEGAD